MKLPTSLVQIIREVSLATIKPLIPTWTYATVTSASPLRVKLDGETDPLTAPPANLAGPLAQGDRVEVRRHGKRITLTACIRATTDLSKLLGGQTISNAASSADRTTVYNALVAAGVSPGTTPVAIWQRDVQKLYVSSGSGWREFAPTSETPPDNHVRIGGVDYRASGRINAPCSMTTASGGGFVASCQIDRPYAPPSGYGFIYQVQYGTTGSVQVMFGGIVHAGTATPTLWFWSPTSATSRTIPVYWTLQNIQLP